MHVQSAAIGSRETKRPRRCSERKIAGPIGPLSNARPGRGRAAHRSCRFASSFAPKFGSPRICKVVTGWRQPGWLPPPAAPAARWLARGSHPGCRFSPAGSHLAGSRLRRSLAGARLLDVVIHTLRVPLALPASRLTTARPTTRSTEDTRAQQLLEVSLRRRR